MRLIMEENGQNRTGNSENKIYYRQIYHKIKNAISELQNMGYDLSNDSKDPYGRRQGRWMKNTSDALLNLLEELDTELRDTGFFKEDRD